MKANNLNDGLYDVADNESIGINPWSARLVINPTAEASVHMVAIPRPKTQLAASQARHKETVPLDTL